MKKRCNACGAVMMSEDIFSTESGNVCRECLNSLSLYELMELAEDEDTVQFITRLAEFVGIGVCSEKL